MLEERDKVDGDLQVGRDLRLYGLVTGNVTVRPGRTLILHGMIGGALLLERGSSVHVYGTIFGDVVNCGGQLRVWGSGIIRGALERGSSAKIEAGAKVRAFPPLPGRDSPVPVSSELAGLRVLVVEDDEPTRDEVVALLHSCSASAIAARGGEDGFEVFVRERPDAIVTDLWMPRVDGYDLIKRVRALSRDDGGMTPAIAMTASSLDSQEKAIRAGFHAHISKPFEPDVLVEILRSFQERQRS